ncbi:MAG TPA: hypothetical protein GXX29_15420, partial [Firmicutes bacterium]|nr:hypothetical protein [Bacillota bacterium]
FRRGQDKPRYSSVTRHGYIGVGPGAGSHLPGEFVLNTFDLQSWQESLSAGSSAIALRLPFVDSMSGWWWLYWRIYDTRIPLSHLETMLGPDAPKARRLLNWLTAARLAREAGSWLELTEAGAFWLHLAQNYFALDYVNTIWTAARRLPWPEEVAI